VPTRTLVLTVLVASCVSSVVTLIVALLILPPAIGAAPDTQARQPTVRAQSFEVVDADGAVQAVLGTDERGTGLHMYGRVPRSQLHLVMQSDGAARLEMINFPQDNQSNAGMTLSPSGESWIGLGTAHGPGVQIRQAPTGSAGLLVRDERYRVRVEAGVQPDSLLGLRVQAATGEAIWQAP
jgi:hypothetical protein